MQLSEDSALLALACADLAYIETPNLNVIFFFNNSSFTSFPTGPGCQEAALELTHASSFFHFQGVNASMQMAFYHLSELKGICF